MERQVQHRGYRIEQGLYYLESRGGNDLLEVCREHLPLLCLESWENIFPKEISCLSKVDANRTWVPTSASRDGGRSELLMRIDFLSDGYRQDTENKNSSWRCFFSCTWEVPRERFLSLLYLFSHTCTHLSCVESSLPNSVLIYFRRTEEKVTTEVLTSHSDRPTKEVKKDCVVTSAQLKSSTGREHVEERNLSSGERARKEGQCSQ